MTTTLAEHFVTILKPLFPENAEFYSDRIDNELQFRIYWKLKNDPDRPNKPSRIILLRISWEAICDYQDATASTQQRADQNLRKFIEGKLRKFNPDHDTLKYSSPPTTEWLITTELLNT